MSQESLDHVISGALFDFVAWLTSRPERICLSGADNAVPAIKALEEFSVMRKLDLTAPMLNNWTGRLSSAVYGISQRAGGVSSPGKDARCQAGRLRKGERK